MSRFPKSLKQTASTWLRKKAKQGSRGFPVATVAFYGPTNVVASKVAVAIMRGENQDPDPLRRWFSKEQDIRADESVLDEIVQFIRQHGVKSVAMADRIIGCPHEEGIDYPEGTSCPQCPYWAGRDRFTHERIQ